MKIKFIQLVLIIYLMIFLQSCSKAKLPGSVNIKKNDFVEISFKDQGYREVLFGTDLYGTWENIPMQKRDTVWIIRFKNPHKEIRYKFLIDGVFWQVDPMNTQKEKVSPPYVGYNSVIDVE